MQALFFRSSQAGQFDSRVKFTFSLDSAGGSPAAGYLSCAAKKGNPRRPPLDSRPVFTGYPCAACLDVATAQLDLARRTQRASLRESNSARRRPHIKASCSARLKGRKCEKALGLYSVLSPRYPVTRYGRSPVMATPVPPCGDPAKSGTAFSVSLCSLSRRLGLCVIVQCWREGIRCQTLPIGKRTNTLSSCSPP
jgi:hypothetical protein